MLAAHGAPYDGATSKNTVDKRPSRSDTQAAGRGKDKVPVSARGRGQSTDSACGKGSGDVGDRGEGGDDGDDEGGSGGGGDMAPASVLSRRRVCMQSKRLRAMFGSQVLINTGTSERGMDSCVSWALPFNITKETKAAVSFFTASYYSSFHDHITDSEGQHVKITSISPGASLPITGSVLETVDRGLRPGQLNSLGVYKPGVLHLTDTGRKFYRESSS